LPEQQDHGLGYPTLNRIRTPPEKTGVDPGNLELIQIRRLTIIIGRMDLQLMRNIPEKFDYKIQF
jgi:hypothetical protein